MARAISAERDAATADPKANSILYELNQLRAAPSEARLRIVRLERFASDLNR